MVLIDDANLEVLDVAAERIPEDDQLHDRERHRHGDQHRTAPESPQLAFDDCPCTSHKGLPHWAFGVRRSAFSFGGSRVLGSGSVRFNGQPRTNEPTNQETRTKNQERERRTPNAERRTPSVTVFAP